MVSRANRNFTPSDLMVHRRKSYRRLYLRHDVRARKEVLGRDLMWLIEEVVDLRI